MVICKEALAKEGQLTTRDLAVRVIKAKNLDEDDHVLRSSITFRIVQAMRMQKKRGKVVSPGKQGALKIWALPPEIT